MIQDITSICALTVALLSLVATYIIFYKNTSPEVIAFLKTGTDKAKSILYLEVKNIGNGFARNVEIYFNGHAKALDHFEIKNVKIPFLHPNGSIEYYVGPGYEVVKKPPIEVTIRYKSTLPIFKFCRKEMHTFILNPEYFIGVEAADNSNLAVIAQTLGKIEKNIANKNAT